jgi:hypothetical protein
MGSRSNINTRLKVWMCVGRGGASYMKGDMSRMTCDTPNRSPALYSAGPPFEFLFDICCDKKTRKKT